MKKLLLVVFLCCFMSFTSFSSEDLSLSDYGTHWITEDTVKPQDPGIALFFELGGKGYYSGNIDFRINRNHRLSFGLTELDYEFTKDGVPDSEGMLSPGIMYYYVSGKKYSFLELGAGVSTSFRLDYDYTPHDHFLSLHAVVGYRYQKPNGLLFRVGFTPFYRPNVWVLPLVGLSLGYSW